MNGSAAATGKLRVVIVEDEPPARRHLHSLLASDSDIEVVGECGDGRAAVDVIERAAPDLVFLDIHIPELTGLEVIEAVGVDRMPAVIFVTAFSDYAVRAFELHALDYLLKPFDEQRLRQTLTRARQQLRSHGSLLDSLSELIATMHEHQPPERLAVRHRGRIRLLSFTDIDYLTAEGSYVRVHSDGEAFLLRDSITAMEARLNAASFARVHRSVIVNIERVREMEPLYRGEFAMWLADGTRLVTGRTYRARVQQLFGV